MSEFRRLMGIDHGEARIGVALSDPFGLFARPHAVIEHTQAEADRAAIMAIVDEEHVVKVVVGLPTDAQGGIGPQARVVIRWARELALTLTIPVVFWDESYSSASAADLLASMGRRSKRRGEVPDDVAAAVILQDYLDAGGSEHEPGQPLEAFADIV